MSLAMMYIPLAVDSRAPQPPPKFPRLARPAESPTRPSRQCGEAPPIPEVLDEEDPERWDGMA